MSNNYPHYLNYASYSDFNESVGTDENGVVTRGEPAQFQEAVQWVGPWTHQHDGFAEHTRRSARALHVAGEKVHLLSTAMADNVAAEVEQQVTDLINLNVGSYRARVIQCSPSERFLSSYVTHRFMAPDAVVARNSATVFYIVTEYEGISKEMARLLNRARQVWTSCRRSMAMLERAGVNAEKLVVVPMPYQPADPLLALRGRKRQPGPPRFLHIGKWEPRKAQHEILGAFMLAFKPNEAQLVMKTSKFAPSYIGYPKNVGESVGEWLDDERVKENGWTEKTLHPSIRMITESVEAERIRALHSWADIYVTLSHGEGFDMPAFDSKLAGNRLVYTASGGPEDFATPDDVAVPFAGHETCHPWYDWSDEAQWTVSRAEDAVDALREAAKRRDEPCGEVSSSFSTVSVGQQMKELLDPLGRSK